MPNPTPLTVARNTSATASRVWASGEWHGTTPRVTQPKHDRGEQLKNGRKPAHRRPNGQRRTPPQVAPADWLPPLLGNFTDCRNCGARVRYVFVPYTLPARWWLIENLPDGITKLPEFLLAHRCAASG